MLNDELRDELGVHLRNEGHGAPHRCAVVTETITYAVAMGLDAKGDEVLLCRTHWRHSNRNEVLIECP